MTWKSSVWWREPQLLKFILWYSCWLSKVLLDSDLTQLLKHCILFFHRYFYICSRLLNSVTWIRSPSSSNLTQSPSLLQPCLIWYYSIVFNSVLLIIKGTFSYPFYQQNICLDPTPYYFRVGSFSVLVNQDWKHWMGSCSTDLSYPAQNLHIRAKQKVRNPKEKFCPLPCPHCSLSTCTAISSWLWHNHRNECY